MKAAQRTKNVGIPTATERHIGHCIRELRMRQHISQKQMGDRLGISGQQLHNLELGKGSITCDRLQGIADIFKTPPSAFFLNSESGDGDPTGGKQGAFKMLTAFLALYQQETREMAIEFVELLAAKEAAPRLHVVRRVVNGQ